MNLCFSIFKRIFSGSALFQRAAAAGLVESQRLFSDEQLAVIRNACGFALEADATLSYAEEKQLQSVQEQIELLLPQEEQEQRSTMEQTM